MEQNVFEEMAKRYDTEESSLKLPVRFRYDCKSNL